jgi:hypothetical protein
MIPRKIGRLPDPRGFNTVRGYSNMAMNKSAGETKVKKSSAKGSTAKKAAPKKAAGAAKKATAKKAAGPKLSEPQKEMLKKVQAHTDPSGYRAEKKPENKTLETLLKHKLVKKGTKHKESGFYHYQVSNAGLKLLKSLEGAGSNSGAGSAPKSS